VQHENDPAYALLYDFVEKPDPVVRIGAIMGLGLAYAGTQKEEVSSPAQRLPFLSSSLQSMENSMCMPRICPGVLDPSVIFMQALLLPPVVCSAALQGIHFHPKWKAIFCAVFLMH